MTILDTDLGKIDLDKGTIQINDEWFSVDDLKKKIKELIEADDFDVSTYTSGLKGLEEELSKYEIVSFKAPKNVIDSIKAISEERSKSFDNTLLDALKDYLKMENVDVEEEPKKKAKPEPEPEEQEEAKEEKSEEPEEEAEEEVEFEIDEAEVEFEDFEEDSDAGDEEEEDKDDEEIDKTTCPRCGGKVPITSTKRPLSIKCPSCGKKGRLLS